MCEIEETDYSDIIKELDRRFEQAEDKGQFLLDLLEEISEEEF